MACVTCPEQFTPEYEKLCGVTPNEPVEEEPVSTAAPTEEIVTFENDSNDNSIEGISQKSHFSAKNHHFYENYNFPKSLLKFENNADDPSY